MSGHRGQSIISRHQIAGRSGYKTKLIMDYRNAGFYPTMQADTNMSTNHPAFKNEVFESESQTDTYDDPCDDPCDDDEYQEEDEPLSDEELEARRRTQHAQAVNDALGIAGMYRSKKHSDRSKSCGMLKVKEANSWTAVAAKRPDPKQLWKSFWHEGEICCLFADSNVGKSIYAVQIADRISQNQKVIYFDFELSDKQFQLRYTDQYGSVYRFYDDFLRCEIDADMIQEEDFEEVIISDIEQVMLRNKAKVMVIDNLTYLCSESERSDSASRLMMKLMQLKKRYGYSILVLAHTPKRPSGQPITQNDLAGSKKLFNFFDSVFAIGKSSKDANLRYVKQIKVRAGEFTYGADNVLLCEIQVAGLFLQFVETGTGREWDHLKREESTQAIAQRVERVKELRQQGKSIRDIAGQLGVSHGLVGRICQRHNL